MNHAMERTAGAVDVEFHRQLMQLVKADNHVAVDRLLAQRRDKHALLNAKPTGCLLLDEATSARMCGVLEAHASDGSEDDGVSMVAIPNVHGAWAMQDAL